MPHRYSRIFHVGALLSALVFPLHIQAADAEVEDLELITRVIGNILILESNLSYYQRIGPYPPTFSKLIEQAKRHGRNTIYLPKFGGLDSDTFYTCLTDTDASNVAIKVIIKEQPIANEYMGLFKRSSIFAAMHGDITSIMDYLMSNEDDAKSSVIFMPGKGTLNTIMEKK